MPLRPNLLTKRAMRLCFMSGKMYFSDCFYSSTYGRICKRSWRNLETYRFYNIYVLCYEISVGAVGILDYFIYSIDKL